MNSQSKVLIIGHTGMIGSSLVRILQKKGFSNLILCSSSEPWLVDQRAVCTFFKKKNPEFCFLTHIKEGGIETNIRYPADLIHKNLIIQTNIIHAAYAFKIQKLIYFASSCVYPVNCPQPMKEQYLLSGPLELSNEAYAVAKIAGVKMCQAYNKQYRTNFISAIPATVFGPNDNFDLESSHVVAALIRKFHESKIENKSYVSVWGTGKPLREFFYVDDLVNACLFLVSHKVDFEIVNIGMGIDISISELAQLIKDIVCFQGKIVFDSSRSDGVKRRLLDVSRLKSLGYRVSFSLKKRLEETYQYYVNSLKKNSLNKRNKYDEKD